METCSVAWLLQLYYGEMVCIRNLIYPASMTIKIVLQGLANIWYLTVPQTACRAKTNPQQCCRRALSSRDCPRQRSCLFICSGTDFFSFFFLLNLLQTGLPKYCETPGHCNNQGVITQECLWASGSCDWLHLLSCPSATSIHECKEKKPPS